MFAKRIGSPKPVKPSQSLATHSSPSRVQGKHQPRIPDSSNAGHQRLLPSHTPKSRAPLVVRAAQHRPWPRQSLWQEIRSSSALHTLSLFFPCPSDSLHSILFSCPVPLPYSCPLHIPDPPQISLVALPFPPTTLHTAKIPRGTRTHSGGHLYCHPMALPTCPTGLSSPHHAHLKAEERGTRWVQV